MGQAKLTFTVANINLYALIMASIFRYGARPVWPETIDDLLGRFDEAWDLTDGVHQYPKVRLRGRLHAGMKKGTLADRGNKQTEKVCCRALLLGRNPDDCWADHPPQEPLLVVEDGYTIPAIGLGEGMPNLWLIEAEVPNQSVDGIPLRAARLDLLGITRLDNTAIFVFIEAKQGGNNDSFVKAVAEVLDYASHLRTDYRHPMNEHEQRSFEQSMNKLTIPPIIQWPPRPMSGAIFAVMADEEWWNRNDGERRQQAIDLAGKWDQRGGLRFWALDIDWRRAHKNRSAAFVARS